MQRVLHAALLGVMINLMSTSTERISVPEWDLPDRLTKALRVADMSVSEMALYLGVHRNSVSAWLNGRTPISGPAIRAWSARTGVDYAWLKTGHPEAPDPLSNAPLGSQRGSNSPGGAPGESSQASGWATRIVA